MSVVIVDTGCANLASVGFAFERLGEITMITRDQDIIAGADRVVLPGVGAAGYAMQNLHSRNLINTLQSLTQPVLGICLGMQILFARSSEGGTQGLGVIDGEIEKLDAADLPLPHMGWNQLDILVDDPLLAGVDSGAYMYFVHSYAAPILSTTLARTEYGSKFSAVVRRDNFYGCQFHPERSGQAGAKILSNFLKVKI
ncbi:MAG TPA: imidazole glycerol phosphate synthase subunit HisH [Hellea balneolensis]|uniref:Imidazole glycerol phosphate synthase subunit HisH n=1 Tax=Hellea balneolensis TaxID=287478 RepID=A0A7C5QP76_9PROT|nr:imidazole glycerol phosphate synthase subunit HisH [Hellea balneolensis]